MWFSILLAAVVGYLLGNLNGAVGVSKLFSHDDVRSHGSGNAGLTNFVRNYGGWMTLLVLAIDIGKTVLACLIGGALLSPYGLTMEGKMIGAIAVTLGHDFPALLGFRGGKGIICGVSIAFSLDWRIGTLILSVFLVLYLLTGYVSLGSIAGGVFLMIGFIIWWRENPLVMAGGIFLGALAVFMHRSNIKKLIQGTESKTNLFKPRKKQ